MSLAESPAPLAYDAFYFQHSCGLPYERTEQWLRFFGKIADQISAGLQPRSVLDAGCAMGFLVEALRDRGIEAYGLDISEYALGKVREDIRPFTWQASVLDPFAHHYDLIVCIEVLEHLPPADAPEAVGNFCQHADNVLFSSTPNDFREVSHINVQPVEYWAELFARQGFYRDVDFDATVIAPWSALFRKTPGPAARAIRDYERKLWLVTSENRELHAQHALMLHSIQVLQNEVAGRGQVIDQITSGLGWQLMQKLEPLRRYGLPPGSRRERLLRRMFGLGRQERKSRL